jgi:leucyl-tRNA synthetase
MRARPRVRATSIKEGFFTGTTRSIPTAGNGFRCGSATFVLMTYGTGAIMAVPAHDERDFEFCTKYGIPIRSVIRPVDGALPALDAIGPRSLTTAWWRIPASGRASGAPKPAGR